MAYCVSYHGVLLPWLLLLLLPTTIGVLLCLLLVNTHVFFFCGILAHFSTMAPPTFQGFETIDIFCYVYWTVHHLDI